MHCRCFRDSFAAAPRAPAEKLLLAKPPPTQPVFREVGSYLFHVGLATRYSTLYEFDCIPEQHHIQKYVLLFAISIEFNYLYCANEKTCFRTLGKVIHVVHHRESAKIGKLVPSITKTMWCSRNAHPGPAPEISIELRRLAQVKMNRSISSFELNSHFAPVVDQGCIRTPLECEIQDLWAV